MHTSITPRCFNFKNFVSLLAILIFSSNLFANTNTHPGLYHVDHDGDGYGLYQEGFEGFEDQAYCEQVNSNTPCVTNNQDCDDYNAARYIGAEEVCDLQLIDEDCNPSTTMPPLETYYQDADGDGYGNVNSTTQYCSQPLGYVNNGLDCDDNNSDFYTPQTWYLDADFDEHYSTSAVNCGSPGYGWNSNSGLGYDCNDENPDVHTEEVWYLDADGDAYYMISFYTCGPFGPYWNQTSNAGQDCNDEDPTLNVSCIYGCTDDLASNYNPQANIDDNSCVYCTYADWYYDADGDGFSSTVLNHCGSPGNGWYDVSYGSDCDDNDINITGMIPWYLDADSDGYSTQTVFNCTSPGAGWISEAIFITGESDCDDNNPNANTEQTWYLDADNDGYRVGTPQQSCGSPGTGWTTNSSSYYTADCDDNNPNANTEQTWYLDADNDSYYTSTQLSCGSPSGEGWKLNAYYPNDCNDNDPTASKLGIWFLDADNDNFYAATQESCGSPGTGWKTTVYYGQDCNDNNSSVSTLQTWYLDADDDNFYATTQQSCGSPGEGWKSFVYYIEDCDDNNSELQTVQTWYLDADNDGYFASTMPHCGSPGDGWKSYVYGGQDCNDNNSNVSVNCIYGCTNAAALNYNSEATNDDGSCVYCVFADWYFDADGDGYYSSVLNNCGSPGEGWNTTSNNGEDCNDADIAIYRSGSFFTDADGDGYTVGAASTICYGASVPTGLIANSLGTDCNDATTAANPAAAEICDGIDNNCNGTIDEGCAPPTQLSSGFCNRNLSSITTTINCVAVSGAQDYEFRIYNGGYDQTRQRLASVTGAVAASIPLSAFTGLQFGTTYNVQVRTRRNNLWSQYGPVCTITTPNRWFKDTDNDGYSNGANSTLAVGGIPPVGYKLPSALTATSGDCNDNNPALNPGASEVCDGLDNNCNGTIDEGCPAQTRLTTAFCNTNITSMSVNLLANAVSGATDYEFRIYRTGYDQSRVRSVTNPGSGSTAAMSLTNFSGLDFSTTYNVQVRARNSNLWGNYGTVCTITTPKQWFKDADNDLYSDGTILIQHAQPAGYKLAVNLTALNGDCNDNNAAVNPAATEVCNGIDDDCDGEIDENVKTTFYADMDEDGFGDLYSSVESCTVPDGYVANSLDCDDQDLYRNPSVTEICNETDDNCNNLTDEGLGSEFYADADGDNYGDGYASVFSCEPPPGYVSDNTDCDDSNFDNNPDAFEICDEIDNNCDNQIDEGVLVTFYFDEDVDGFGGATSIEACYLPDGYTEENNDCDDNNGDVFPDAVEICNLIDDNCDYQTDEGVQTTFYFDQDADTYGDLYNTTLACELPEGYVTNTTDCDDNDALAHEVLVWYHDNDQDGYDFESQEDCGAPGEFWSLNPGTMGDCDDNDPIAHEELSWYFDGDNDGYSSQSEIACGTPGEYYTLSVLGEDCDDNNAIAHEVLTWYFDSDEDGYKNESELSCGTPGEHWSLDAGISGDCDDEDPTAHEVLTWYFDGDQDGYHGFSQEDCGNPGGGMFTFFSSIPSVEYWSLETEGEDCNDLDPTVYEPQPYFVDADFDTYGSTTETTACTSVATQGLSTNNNDCNDNNEVLNPATVWFKDVDNDLYSDGTTLTQCEQPDGYQLATNLIEISGDCNDNDAVLNPATVWYQDIDNDLYSDGTSQTQCEQPNGYQLESNLIATNGDCNDNDPVFNPTTVWYSDADQDLYSNGNTITQCSPQSDYTLASMLISTSGDCNDNDAVLNPTTVWYKDYDNDYYSDGTTVTQCEQLWTVKLATALIATSGDCNDNDAVLNPATVWYLDADNDSYSDGTTLTQCEQPDGYQLATSLAGTSGDSNDNDPVLNPTTVWYKDMDDDSYSDGITQTQSEQPVGYKLATALTAISGDCDDNDAVLNPATVWYKDADNDLYSDGTTLTQCVRPTNYKLATALTATSGDCNDNNAVLNPTTVWFKDVDNDLYSDGTTQTQCAQPSNYKLATALTSTNGDCDDNNAVLNPTTVWYLDADNDSYSNGSTQTQCEQPTNYELASALTANSGDCNDGVSAINPAASEVCDGIDNNCNGSTDEGCPGLTSLNSTFCNSATVVSSLSSSINYTPVSGAVDYEVNIFNDDLSYSQTRQRVATVGTNGLSISLGSFTGLQFNTTYSVRVRAKNSALWGQYGTVCTITTPKLWYIDRDNDGYSNGNTLVSHTQPSPGGVLYRLATDLIAISGDCNDNNATINPAAIEVCDNLDNNCNSTIDEGVRTTFYADADGDNFGDPNSTIQACVAPENYVSNNTDCDDNNGLASELATYYIDADGDGLGNPSVSQVSCGAPIDYVTNDDDCDDTDYQVAQCPIDAVVSDWSEWSECTAACGGGTTTRTREIISPAQFGGFTPALVETQACNEQPCPIDAVVSDWSDWSECTAACGGGTTTRTREIISPAQFGGFTPELVETQACNEQPCPIDAVVSDWSDWSECTAACGGGTTTRTREIISPAQFGGFTPELVETQACNEQPCPIDAVVSDWSAWSECTAACGGGTRTRTRTLLSPAQFGGTTPSLIETEDCNTQPAVTYFQDADGDGFGSALVSIQACSLPSGYVTNNTDCNDASATVNSAQVEVRGNGIDDNCNGQTDEGNFNPRLANSFCGITITTANQYMSCVVFAQATQYRFLVTNTVLGYSQTYTAPAGSIVFRMSFVTGLTGGITYQVRVAGLVNGQWSAYGTPCNVTTPAVLKLEDELSSENSNEINFEVNLHPNPFSSTLNLSHNATGHSVDIQMVDVVGKLVYEAKTTASEITIGNGLAKGLYHVIITVGDQRKVLRVIKE